MSESLPSSIYSKTLIKCFFNDPTFCFFVNALVEVADMYYDMPLLLAYFENKFENVLRMIIDQLAINVQV